MKTRLALNLLLATAAIISLMGCKGGDTFVGSWTGPKGTTLALNEDKTFTLTGTGAGAAAGNLAGKWTGEANGVTLQIETVGGKPKQAFLDEMKKMADSFGKSKEADAAMKTLTDTLNNMKLNASADKKSLSMTNPARNPGTAPETVTFTKAEAAK